MSINEGGELELLEGDRLKHEINFYTKYILEAVISGRPPSGYLWKLGKKESGQQVFANNTKKILSPTEEGIITLGLVQLGDFSLSPKQYVQDIFYQLGIVERQDSEKFAQILSNRMKTEHKNKEHFQSLLKDNIAKVTMLTSAYRRLQKERREGRPLDIEDRVILGMIISTLGGVYEIRPYMIDTELTDETWIEVFDHLFHNFSTETSVYFEANGYGNQFRDFLRVRNAITHKKRAKSTAVLTCNALMWVQRRFAEVFRLEPGNNKPTQ